MTEQERYTIEKDLVNEKLCIWDYDDLICEIDDDKALIILVNLLNKLNEENEQLKQFKSKVLKLLDEKIKHYEHKPVSAPVGQPMSVNFDADMDRIARLSELQHLRKELG